MPAPTDASEPELYGPAAGSSYVHVTAYPSTGLANGKGPREPGEDDASMDPSPLDPGNRLESQVLYILY